MREVAIQNTEPSSTWEATELMAKIPDSTYAKAELKKLVDNASQMNYE